MYSGVPEARASACRQLPCPSPPRLLPPRLAFAPPPSIGQAKKRAATSIEGKCCSQGVQSTTKNLIRRKKATRYCTRHGYQEHPPVLGRLVAEPAPVAPREQPPLRRTDARTPRSQPWSHRASRENMNVKYQVFWVSTSPCTSVPGKRLW